MKVLIIGATGMLAKPVIHHLAKNGFELRLFSRSIQRGLYPDKYELAQGDIFNETELDQAIQGCDAIHVNLGRVDEAKAMRAIVDSAKKQQIKLISYISGNTVREENRWSKLIDGKFQAEQALVNSGIPYLIFRPGWFFESLKLMVRNGRAVVIGKQPHPSHWLAADDYGRIVAEAFQKPETANHIIPLYGPKSLTMKPLLGEYCRVMHPKIGKIPHMPIWLMSLIARITKNEELKEATLLFAYFEKTKEPALEVNELFSQPKTTFEHWLKNESSNQFP